MQEELSEIREELARLRGQVRRMRLVALVSLGAVMCVALVRPGLTQNGGPSAAAAPPRPATSGDRFRPGPLPLAKPKALNVRAPLRIFSRAGRLVAEITESVDGGGMIVTYDSTGNLMTYSGISGAANNGLHLAAHAATDGSAAAYVETTNGGKVETKDSAGTTTFLAP
jgi:hypothetical protein